MITNNISTITELRFKTKDVLKKATNEPVFLFNRSTPTSVLLSYKNYEELMSTMEDLYDSLRAEEYESSDKKKTEWLSSNKVNAVLFPK